MSRGTAGTLLTGSALAALLLAPAPGLRAQEGAAADTAAAPDTVEAVGDTAGAPGDTAAARADTTRRADLEQVKEGLSGGTFPQRDSLFGRLAEMPGFRVLEYRGKDVEMLVDSRVIVLRDSAQANYGDAALLADSITYRARERFVTARGDILLVSPGRREMTSDSVLYYDVSRRKGTVLGARTQFAERGSTWQVRGDAVPLGGDTVFVERGSFSSCQLEVPHYYFKGGQIKMVSQNVIVAWPVVLYISEVPVFWLPFFAQDIRPGRRSGIIPPQFGFNDVVRTSGTLNRHIQDFGYYWAISPFMDARATMDWFSGEYTRLNGEFRYNFRKSFIRGRVSGSREWGDTGDNFTVRFDHDQELTPDTRLRADGTYVENTRLRTARSFDHETQTQTIDSNVGLTHDFGWGRVDVSGRRRQFLEEAEQVDLTLPDVRLNLSPVTLFEAPRGRGGPFSNLTWSGNATYSRKSQSREQSTDRLNTTAGLNNSLRLGELSLSTGANLSDVRTTPVRTVVDTVLQGPDSARVDSSFVDLPSSDQTTVDWRASADYQLDLMGSTTLSPTVQVRKSWFRSSVPGDSVLDTGGSFLGGPTRTSVGANLRTDLYGFLPGFGPFTRIRHKISPRFSWRYEPSVSVPPSRDSIPGFPGGGGRAVNRLTVGLNQTFEAKLEQGAGRDTSGAAEDTADAAAPADTARPAAALDTGGAARGGSGTPGAGSGAQPAGGDGARKITLLSLRSDPLTFDFEASKRGEPALTTDRWGHSLSSDLLQGLTMNLELDLFEGTGEDRTFDPFLSAVSAGFSLSSGASLGDIIGLGGGGGARRPPRPARPGLGGLEQQAARGADEDRREDREAGPWNLNLHYSLSRAREGAAFGRGGNNQSLSGTLNFNPTPNWRVTWNTQYSFTRSEFGYHQVTLIRELHRWSARFNFQKATNGNFLFQVLVRLEDAPELKVDYNQRSEPVRR